MFTILVKTNSLDEFCPYKLGHKYLKSELPSKDLHNKPISLSRGQLARVDSVHGRYASDNATYYRVTFKPISIT